MSGAGKIRFGIGGWTFEPWRNNFYPEGLAQSRELEYASRQLTAIEINGTFYGSQKPSSFAKWRDETPDDFVFSMKATRYATNRKILGEAGESITRFVNSGIAELRHKLGPILWQFMATKKFDADDFGAFLKLLPASHEGVALRHAVQVRHDSFHVPEFVDLCRKAGVAIVYAESADYPAIADVTGDFVYARLENAVEEEPQGYSSDALDHWAKVAKDWAGGGSPEGLPYAADRAPKTPRDTFIFMINGAKVRAPAAAQALISRL